MLRSMAAMLWVLLLVFAPISISDAQETSAYELRSAAFTLPANWKVTHSSRDQEYDFISPDGRYELWARWWFPDEPLLGFDDIVRHEKRHLAGQDALFIQVEPDGSRTLEMAFLQKDAEGEIFLWQLVSGGASLAEHQAMFDSLLLGLTMDGLPATAQPVEPGAQDAEAAVAQDMYRDPDGAFALPLPKGWTAQTADAAQGLRQVVLVSPARDAILLAVTAQADRGLTAAQVLDEYIGALYRDALVVKSIEGEGYPDIAGTTVHAMETTAKVFAFNDVALAYTRGRVWIYRSADETGGEAGGRVPFVIVTIRPETASDDLTRVLESVALGFTFDTGTKPSISTQGAAKAKLPTQGLLFDGKSIGGLLAFAFNNVSFEDNAKLTGDAISFRFPDGKGLAKLGMATPTAVVAMPKRGGASVQRITAVIDADQSSGISFALLPMADAEKDPDLVNDVKFRFLAIGDGTGKLEVTTRDPQQSYSANFPWPKGQAVLQLLLRPDQVLDIRDGSGSQLAEWAMDADFDGRQWALQTFVQVNARDRAASLVLKRLSVDTIPFQSVPKIDSIAQEPRSAVIFDGYSFGQIWEPVSRRNGEVARFLRLSNGALRVEWTPEDKGSWTGMFTPQAALWLDRFTGDAEARVDLALDGAASKDFEIALQSAYSLPGNLSGNTSYVLRFTLLDDGTYSVLSALRSREKDGLIATGLPAIPDAVTLVLTPEGVRVDGAGMPEGVLPFDQIADGAGLRIAIHARSTLVGDAALALRAVRVSLRPGRYPDAVRTQDGVAPLAQTVFFNAAPDQNWEARSTGKAIFSELAVQHADSLTLNRRDPTTDWSRIALVGSAVVANLDYRIDTTPYEVLVKLDPEPGLGTRIFLHSNADGFEKAAESVVTLRELTSGPELGGLEVQLHTGHFSYDHWRRVLPAEQWRTGWDGTVRLRFGPKWIALGLGDDWLMRGNRTSLAMMLAITPGGAANMDGGHVTLHSITAGWVTPDGMTARQRLALLEVKDFDPIAFLDLLNAE